MSRKVGVKTPFQLWTRNSRDALLYGAAILILGTGTIVMWWLLS
jgi:hypothetical protein